MTVKIIILALAILVAVFEILFSVCFYIVGRKDEKNIKKN